MRRFSPLSSVAMRVDGSVTARNFSVSRYGTVRFLKISEPQVKSGKAVSVTTPSAERPANLNGPEPTGSAATSPGFSVARYFADITPKK